MRCFLILALGVLSASAVLADGRGALPEGYWPEEKVAELLAKTETVRLTPERLISRRSAALR